VYYGAIDDTRGCSSCTCGSPTGIVCEGLETQYGTSNGSCLNQAQQGNLPLACTADVDSARDWRLDYGPSGGSCAANPVSSTGSATPANPTTFCCSQ
jgi:hypothetical protein